MESKRFKVMLGYNKVFLEESDGDAGVKSCRIIWDGSAEDFANLVARNSELVEENKRLLARAAHRSIGEIWLGGVLRKYGRHTHECVKFPTYDIPCSCGWDGVKKSLLPPDPATTKSKEKS